MEAEQKLTTREEFDILGGTEKELSRKRSLANAATKYDST
jgi:hypothetical protein